MDDNSRTTILMCFLLALFTIAGFQITVQQQEIQTLTHQQATLTKNYKDLNENYQTDLSNRTYTDSDFTVLSKVIWYEMRASHPGNYNVFINGKAQLSANLYGDGHTISYYTCLEYISKNDNLLDTDAIQKVGD